MFIDTHTHLQWKDFDDDRAMVIGNAKKAGVKQFIVPGVDPHSCEGALHLASQHPGIIFAAIGFHPYEAQKITEISYLKSLLVEVTKLRTNESSPHIVAIGECGLDYHLFKGEDATSKKDHQKRLFELQLLLALKHDLPVIMHVRDAFEDFFTVFDSLPALPRGVIHCFSGALQEVRMATERKLYMGIDGNSSYAKQLTMIIPSIPLTNILLETDAPYLTPVPHRGSRNEPKYIPLIAASVAQLHGVNTTDVASATTQNACTLFRI